jgi:fructose-1,6-bisphosphatase II
MVEASISRNISMELARVTEAAALTAGRWMGRDQKESADQAAVDSIRQVLGTIAMEGEVVIGEGQKDEAPMLYHGEILGSAPEPKVDIAVDPIDGTRLLAKGMPNSIAVLAIAERGAMYKWEHISYMDKIAVGPSARGAIDLRDSPEKNLERIAKAKGRHVNDLTVVVLDRPRHEELIGRIRDAGARLKLIIDGDVAGALMSAMSGTGIDAVMGIGGSPEAVIAACALKCVGGDMQCRLHPRNEEEQQLAADHAIDMDRIWGIDDLVRGDEAFFAATGITDGELLDGVHYGKWGASTHTLVMRAKTGTVRYIKSTHRLEKLATLGHVPWD